MDPEQPVHSVATLEAVIRSSITTRRTFAILLIGFAAVALIIAALGVYAITAQSVASRTQDIGIRMAMGAEPWLVLRMIVAQEVRVVLAGLVLGTLCALAATRAICTRCHRRIPPRSLVAATSASERSGRRGPGRRYDTAR